MSFERIVHTETDRRFYASYLKEFLPEHIFDAHMHLWELRHRSGSKYIRRGEDWAEQVEQAYPMPMLREDYDRLFPDQTLRGLIFGWVGASINVEANNRYVGELVRENPGWYGLAVICPEWDRETTLRQIEGNGLRGMKPYITFAAPEIATPDITIYDILTPEQWELADARGYVCTLHLPRPGRLHDPKNVEQLLEIDRKYPNARVIVAHIGRCYSNEDMGDAFEQLKDTKNLCFDFSGNTNALVIRRALEIFGHQRMLYGSDLPLTHIHMKRVYQNGHYLNLIRGDERPQINHAAYMQPMPDAKNYTYYLYESIHAFQEAAEALGLNRAQVEDVMCRNALRLLEQ